MNTKESGKSIYTDEGLPDRMKAARFSVASIRRETVSQGAMAELVSAVLGRRIHQTQWGRYESGESEPPLDVIRVTAAVSEMDEVYLAFGYERFPASLFEELPGDAVAQIARAVREREHALAEAMPDEPTEGDRPRRTALPKHPKKPVTSQTGKGGRKPA